MAGPLGVKVGGLALTTTVYNMALWLVRRKNASCRQEVGSRVEQLVLRVMVTAMEAMLVLPSRGRGMPSSTSLCS